MVTEYRERLKKFLASDTKKAKIATVALCALALAAVPVLVVGAGAMGNAVKLFKSHRASKSYSRKQIWSAVNSLKRQQMIEYVCERNGKTVVRITKKGESRLRAFSIELMEIKKPKTWDSKWHLVMYDLPVRFKKVRESLRFHLKELDCYQFQKSAWIHPYPCEDEIIFIADFYGIGKYIEVLTVENINRDNKLKRYFNLP